jgi:hypothetical protein
MGWFPPSGGGSGGGGGGGGSSPFNLTSILGGVGGIGEIIGSLLQSSQYSQLLGGLTNDMNSVLGPEVNMGTGFLSNFKNQVAPELQGVYGSQTALGGQSYGTAGNYASGAAGAAGALESNPYIGGATPLIGGLENYKSFTPQEEAALTTGAGEAASSAAKTMAAQSGGVANPALLAENLAGAAGTQSSQTAVQLGSIASQQHLQAMEDALQGKLAQGSEYTSAESAAGGIYSGLSSEYAGLSESEFTNALDSLGIQSSELSTGAGLLGNAGSSISNILDQVYGSSQQSGGGYGGVLGGLTSFLGSGLIPL